ncbi:MAG TPA: hypothetical protein VHE53_05910 [Patescibacteria group bacterium]|nr:hypothetical protein [Patescibacteria group bacterium]
MADTKVKSGSNLLMTGVIVVVVAAVAFFGGMQYQKMQRPSGQFAATNGQGRFVQGAARFGMGNGTGRGNGINRPIIGQIISTDANGITIKMADGSTKIILVGSDAKINKTDTGTKSDFKNGINVLVVGTTNSDGTVTATNVQINPGTMMFGNRPSGTPTPAQ